MLLFQHDFLVWKALLNGSQRCCVFQTLFEFQIVEPNLEAFRDSPQNFCSLWLGQSQNCQWRLTKCISMVNLKLHKKFLFSAVSPKLFQRNFLHWSPNFLLNFFLEVNRTHQVYQTKRFQVYIFHEALAILPDIRCIICYINFFSKKPSKQPFRFDKKIYWFQ